MLSFPQLALFTGAVPITKTTVMTAAGAMIKTKESESLLFSGLFRNIKELKDMTGEKFLYMMTTMSNLVGRSQMQMCENLGCAMFRGEDRLDFKFVNMISFRLHPKVGRVGMRAFGEESFTDFINPKEFPIQYLEKRHGPTSVKKWSEVKGVPLPIPEKN
jgi:hypothetical protein